MTNSSCASCSMGNHRRKKQRRESTGSRNTSRNLTNAVINNMVSTGLRPGTKNGMWLYNQNDLREIFKNRYHNKGPSLQMNLFNGTNQNKTVWSEIFRERQNTQQSLRQRQQMTRRRLFN